MNSEIKIGDKGNMVKAKELKIMKKKEILPAVKEEL